MLKVNIMKEVKAYNGQIIKVGETYSFADFEIVDKDEENIIQSIIRITDLR